MNYYPFCTEKDTGKNCYKRHTNHLKFITLVMKEKLIQPKLFLFPVSVSILQCSLSLPVMISPCRCFFIAQRSLMPGNGLLLTAFQLLWPFNWHHSTVSVNVAPLKTVSFLFKESNTWLQQRVCLPASCSLIFKLVFLTILFCWKKFNKISPFTKKTRETLKWTLFKRWPSKIFWNIKPQRSFKSYVNVNNFLMVK